MTAVLWAAGDIYINRMVGGVSQGMVGSIYADKFEIKPSVDVKEATSKGRYSYGQVLDTVNLAKPTDFTIDLSEVTGDILVMASWHVCRAESNLGHAHRTSCDDQKRQVG